MASIYDPDWGQDEPEDDGGWDADEAYERWLETRYEEDPQDLIDEANDVGLQELRRGRA